MLQDLNKNYDEGMNMEKIGEKYGISRSTVCNYIWKPRAKGTVSDFISDKAMGKEKHGATKVNKA